MNEKKSIEELVREVEAELGISNAVVFAKGNVVCEESRCIKIFVYDYDSFKNILIALVRQGVATGGLPILVIEKEGISGVEYYIVDYIDGLVVEYVSERR